MTKIALYIRLSKEIDKVDESESIKNQRDLLRTYVDNFYCDSRVVEFVDEGFSGTNFERPAFKKLLESVENKQIDVILVKDLSRLGRNYIDSMHYIEQVFPLYNVKLVAVNDNIDTMEYSGSASIETSFKALIHSYYSKDLSKKIKSSLKNKALKGQWYGGSFYGYRKNSEDKYKLELDLEASSIVADIFKMALDGMPMSNIVKKLNADGVLSPMQYIVENNLSSRTKWDNKSEEVYWTYFHVWKILKDERYTGKLIFRKKEMVEVGSKRRRNTDENEWIVVPNCIEPIITSEQFNLVQKLINSSKYKKGEKRDDPLANKVVCGHCNRNLRKHIYIYKENKKVRYNCCFYKNTDKELCFDGFINREDIEKVIIKNVCMQIKLFGNLKRKDKLNKKKLEKELNVLLKEERDLETKATKVKSEKSRLVEKLVEDIVSEEEFKKLNSDLEKNLNEYRLELTHIINKKNLLIEKMSDTKIVSILSRLENGMNNEKAIECLAGVIEKIIVFDSQKMEVVFNFEDYFSEV